MLKPIAIATCLFLPATLAWGQGSGRDGDLADHHSYYEDARDSSYRGPASNRRRSEDNENASGARFFLRSGDTRLRVHCDPQESMRSCVDAALRMLEKATPQGQTASPSPATTQAIEELRSEYVNAFNGGDAAKLANLYHENATYMPASGQRFDGRGSIERQLQADLRNGVSGLKVEPQETMQIGNSFYDTGTYSLSSAGAAGQQKTTVRGSYFVLVQPTADGKLRIKHHIANMETMPSIQ